MTKKQFTVDADEIELFADCETLKLSGRISFTWELSLIPKRVQEIIENVRVTKIKESKVVFIFYLSEETRF